MSSLKKYGQSFPLNVAKSFSVNRDFSDYWNGEVTHLSSTPFVESTKCLFDYFEQTDKDVSE